MKFESLGSSARIYIRIGCCGIAGKQCMTGVRGGNGVKSGNGAVCANVNTPVCIGRCGPAICEQGLLKHIHVDKKVATLRIIKATNRKCKTCYYFFLLEKAREWGITFL